jgi:F420-dependent oxidoreductase-like protein
VQIGAFVPQGWRLDLVGLEEGVSQYQAMRQVALRLERLGYHHLWLYDHFHPVPRALPEATFEAWTALTALAEATTSIRLGHMVGCAFYRPPALVAKMAACLDVISQGRLEFGLGAGWYEHEAVAYGYPFPPPGVRLEQLDEALQIILGLWEHGRFRFEGRHYRVGVGRVRDYHGQQVDLDGALCLPRPVQRPRPPVWVGGGGERKTLAIVARRADWSNFGAGNLEAVKRKNEILDGHCRAIGRDPAEVRRSTTLNVMMAPEAEVDRLLLKLGRTPQEVAAWKSDALIGTDPGPLVERLVRLRDQGRIQAVQIYFPDAVYGDSIERFAAQVMPALRA